MEIIWTLVRECDVPEEAKRFLRFDEVVRQAYETPRSYALVTNKRLLIAEGHGLTGKKVQQYSLPYSSMIMWARTNAGSFLDAHAELDIWTQLGHIKLLLKKEVDLDRLEGLLTEHIL